MWIVQTLVCIENPGGDDITRPFSLPYRAGRIPSRATIQQDAYEAARQWVHWLADTVGSGRQIEYGNPCGLTIVSIDFVK